MHYAVTETIVFLLSDPNFKQKGTVLLHEIRERVPGGKLMFLVLGEMKVKTPTSSRPVGGT